MPKNNTKLKNEELCLGDKIRLYRKRSGLSQLSLEIEAMIPIGSVCRIERNLVNPSKETISRIAQTLKLTPLEIADLFGINLSQYLENKEITKDTKFDDINLS